LGLKYTVAGKTDIGLVRSINEDYFRIDEENNLFVVCDGMGGHQAGEVASKEACDIITHCFSTLAEEIISDEALKIPARFAPRSDLLIKAIRIANRSIYIRSRSRSDLSGMGTTVIAAVLEDHLIGIAHAGDSRAYRLTENRLVQLTSDHSWVSELQKNAQYTEEEAAEVINRNIITRALGVRERVEIDFRADSVKPGEIYILCTDGLSGYARNEEIQAAAVECGDDIDKIVDNLVKLAIDQGGSDNITVVAIRIDEVQDNPELEMTKPVTVGVESDDTMYRENQILDSIIKLQEDSQEVITQAYRPKKPAAHSSIIIPIVILVVIIAVLYVLFVR
jgi:serine/threonine protein phosphatase PrpC